jgi:peptide deformylase
MWEWLEFLTEDAGNCLGLAAVQIGIPVRAFYLKLPNEEAVRFRNPEIIKKSKKKVVFKDEGCMSFPGKFVDTERHVWVTVRDDINGEKTYKGLLAVCIQHEMEHLDGKFCFDSRAHSQYIREEEKIGRNDPCPCGSKKKYKKCCGG